MTNDLGKSDSQQLSAAGGSARRTQWLIWAAAAGVAVYLAAFFAWPLQSLREATGFPWRRLHLVLAFHPQELWDAWVGAPPEFALGDRLPVLALAGLILGWAALFGRLAIDGLRLDREFDRLETWVFSLGVGLNAISTWVLAAGLAGRLDRWTTFLLPAGATAAVFAWRAMRAGRGRPAPPPPEDPADISARWLWLAAPFAVAILLGGMLPPAEFDVREYHFQAPKEFYQAGRIEFLPHNVYGNMALGTEMFSLLGMSLAGDWWLGTLVGKTVIALFAPLGAAALFAAGRRFFSTTAGVVAAVVYLSTGAIAQVSTIGMVEGASALYLLLAVYSLATPLSSEARPRGAALAGYCVGAAIATKYLAVLFVAVPLAGWLAAVEIRRGRRAAWKPLAAFALACLVGCGLWFGKNWVFTGNPTYPLLYRVFGGATWTPEKNAYWSEVHRPHDFSPAALAGDAVHVAVGSEWMGPLVMPLAALAFLGRKRRFAAALAGYFGFVLAAWWLTALRIDRYWLPALPLAALLAGAGAAWTDDQRWRRFALSLLLATSLYNFIVVTGGPCGYNAYFVSLKRVRSDPDRVDPWHRYFNQAARGGRVLLVGEAQVFDLEVPLIYNTWIDDSAFERITRGRTPDEVQRALTDEGVTHVYVHWGEIARYVRTGYGRWDFATPEVFDRLVDAGVLLPLPPLGKHPGRGFRVVQAAGR